MNEIYQLIIPEIYFLLSISLFFLGLIGLKPMWIDEREYTLFELFTVYFRRANIAIIPAVIFLPSLFFLPYTLYKLGYENTLPLLIKIFINPFMNYWLLYLTALVGGVFLRVIYLRYLKPMVSSWVYHLRVKQKTDLVSDMRTESINDIAKDFNPSKYYKKHFIFRGLDEKNKPVYEQEELWKGLCTNIIGPTQTGKGVLIGVELDQAIRKDHCVVFIDPKPDKHARAIMKKACEETGRPFIELDFNGEIGSKQGWGPFFEGTEREIIARLIYMADLADTGTNADFYKKGERKEISNIVANGKWNRKISSLHDLIKDNDNCKAVERMLSELRTMPSVNPSNNKAGVSIDKTFNNNAVLYVRTNTDDSTIIKITTTFIQNLVQAAKKTYRSETRKQHLFICIDEVRFFTSEILADSLATITGFNAHISIAYQSVEDLKNVKDKTLDAMTIYRSVLVNCKATIAYQPKDYETAEWIAKETGEIQVNRYMQNVETNEGGGETYHNTSRVSSEKQYYFSINALKLLKPRVAILLIAGRRAVKIYTCFIPININDYPEVKIERKQNEGQNKNNKDGEQAVKEQSNKDYLHHD